VHGCFWHGHDCPLFKSPATREAFWTVKIAANRQRDKRAAADLAAAGWRVLTVWECSLKGPARLPLAEVIHKCGEFVRGHKKKATLRGGGRVKN
jgi:DNA mismatch endonuclease (patch repair protein)